MTVMKDQLSVYLLQVLKKSCPDSPTHTSGGITQDLLWALVRVQSHRQERARLCMEGLFVFSSSNHMTRVTYLYLHLILQRKEIYNKIYFRGPSFWQGRKGWFPWVFFLFHGWCWHCFLFWYVLKASCHAWMLLWTWKRSITTAYFVHPNHYLINPI